MGFDWIWLLSVWRTGPDIVVALPYLPLTLTMIPFEELLS
jgi:hypothetical protein